MVIITADLIKKDMDGRYQRVVMGPMQAIALNRKPYITVTSGGAVCHHYDAPPRPAAFDTEAEAMNALHTELLMWYRLQQGDTLYWRKLPEAEQDPDTHKWQARCRLLIGYKADENAEDIAEMKTDGITFTVEKSALPRWRSHKVVEADRIVGAEFDAGGMYKLPIRWRLACGQVIQVSEDLGRRVHPVGTDACTGYFVRYEDGYESWSPADAFEKGNTEQVEGRTAVAQAILDLESTVLRAFEPDERSDPAFHQLVRVARRLCLDKGMDPDMVVIGGKGMAPPIQGLDDSILVRQLMHPAWYLMGRQIQAVLGVVRRDAIEQAAGTAGK